MALAKDRETRNAKYARQDLKRRGTTKQRARDNIRQAVFLGRISRPKTCSKCKSEDTIEAHHPDYSRPYFVLWLCLGCHLKIHGRITMVRVNGTCKHGHEIKTEKDIYRRQGKSGRSSLTPECRLCRLRTSRIFRAVRREERRLKRNGPAKREEG